MNCVAYASPWVPPEWISAHGLRPDWMRLGRCGSRRGDEREGVCPYAGAMIEAVLAGGRFCGVVLATTCDQMRHAAALLDRESRLPVFLLNVPSTCEAEADALYRHELARLGRFLVSLGGKPPTADELAQVMLGYDKARAAFRSARANLSARQAAEAILEIRRGKGEWESGREGEKEKWKPIDSSPSLASRGSPLLPFSSSPTLPLALLGGPLAEEDFELLDLIESLGGRVVLDATEGGERTLPASPDAGRLHEDPLAELARIYFDAIVDHFRRPNDGLYAWLERQIAARHLGGIVFRRYVWCDLWHAELARLKERIPLPVLELDVADDDHTALGRTAARVEAFLEMLERSGRKKA